MTEQNPTNNDVVLVTGATGCTGGALARELGRRGRRVRALVRDAAKAGELEQAGMELVVGDIRDANAVDRAVAGSRFVYHIAAAYRTAGDSAQYYREVNADAVGTILEAARRHGVERTMHCSTAGVHGHVDKHPSDETAPYNPGDVYQESKLEGERIAQKAIENGQPVSIVRPAGIYGPGDTRFLKLFKTINNKTFRMFGTGMVPYHLTYIDDLISGMILCAEKQAADGEVFLICGDEYETLNDLVFMVANALDVEPPRGNLPLWPLMTAAYACEWLCRPLKINPPLYPRRCEFFVKARAFTNRKARDLLGFSPQVSLKDGLRRTADWYRAEGLLPPPGTAKDL